MEIKSPEARRALKSTFEVAIRGGVRTAESVLIRVAWSSSLSQGFDREGHEGARSQSRRKRRMRTGNFGATPAISTNEGRRLCKAHECLHLRADLMFHTSVDTLS